MPYISVYLSRDLSDDLDDMISIYHGHKTKSEIVRDCISKIIVFEKKAQKGNVQRLMAELELLQKLAEESNGINDEGRLP